MRVYASAEMTLTDTNDGISVTGIDRYYMASSSSSGITVDSPGWKPDPQETNPISRYHWSYEVVNYSSGPPVPSKPAIIGVYGKDGYSTYVAYLSLDNPLTEDPSLLYSTNGIESYPNTSNLRRETYGDSNKLVVLNNSGIIRKLNPDISRVDNVSPEKLKDKEVLAGKEVRSTLSDDSVSMVTIYGETKVTDIGERNTYNASNINYSNVSSASLDNRNALVTSKNKEVFYPISNPVSGVYRVTFDYKVVDSASVPPKVIFYYADGTTDEATSPSLTSTTWKTITLSSKANGTVIGIGYSDPRDDDEDVEEPTTPQVPIEDNAINKVVEIVAIPYKVIEREDTELELGKTRVEVVGKDGKKEITTIKIGSNGTPKVTEKILENPVDEIRYIGSKSTEPTTPPAEDNEVITKVTTEPIAYKTIRRNNANMYVGTENTVQKGVNGIREITTVTIGSTGTPTVTTRVIVDPIDEIIDVGTLPRTSTVNFTVVKKEEVVEPPVTTSPKVVMLGDSITMGYGRSSKIPDVIKQELSAEMVQNAGYGSTTASLHPTKPELRKIGFSKLVDSIVSGSWTEALNVNYSGITYATPTAYKQSITELSKTNFSSVDTIIIMYGTNDWAMDVKIDNANDRYDQSTYLGALRYGINKLQKAYPHLEILVAQPILWTMGAMNSENYNNGIGLKVKDYANALNNSLNMGVPVAQVYNKGITTSNYKTYFNTGDSTDGTHPNSAGNIVIGKLIASEFIRLLGDTRGDSSVINFNIVKATETENTSTVTINFLN